MDETNVAVAKESSTPVNNEPAKATEEHEKQIDEEEVNDEIIISTKKRDSITNQPTKEEQESTKGNWLIKSPKGTHELLLKLSQSHGD